MDRDTMNLFFAPTGDTPTSSNGTESSYSGGEVPPSALDPTAFDWISTAPLDTTVAMKVEEDHDAETTPHASTSDGQAALAKRKKAAKPLPPGAIVTDRSCLRCRDRKVRCDRLFPMCTACRNRKEACDLATWAPKPKPKPPADPERVLELERRLEELEGQLAIKRATPAFDPAATALAQLNQAQPVANFSHLVDSPESGLPNIGAGSLDWRLATPQLAASLSQHLCDAFVQSCCFQLPTYEFFKSRVADLRSEGTALQDSPAGRVAIAAFRAVGARTSTHSAVLGIEITETDTRDHPNAPLLSAGTRREQACLQFLSQAHQLAFNEDVAENCSIDNLAACLTILQMSMFVEAIRPKKSRTVLRSALDQYYELQTSAMDDSERNRVKQMFGFALYSADAVIAASSGRKSFITENDLKTYFDKMGLVIPRLPSDKLRPVLDKLLLRSTENPLNTNPVKTIRHLLHCWTCVCQRMYSDLAAPPKKAPLELARGVRRLWLAIDETRDSIQYVLAFLAQHENASQPHDHSAAGHSHEHDYSSQIIRLDRDLLDLISLVHMVLLGGPGAPELPELGPQSTSRVRKGLKTAAFYAKLYTVGKDIHMVFHHFTQLEFNPHWTEMALQRVGDVPGPLTIDEELTEMEISWLIEGLQHDCFYHPDAERRLAELSPRFTPINPLALSSPSFQTLSAATPPSMPSLATNDLDFSIDAFLATMDTSATSDPYGTASWDLGNSTSDVYGAGGTDFSFLDV